MTSETSSLVHTSNVQRQEGSALKAYLICIRHGQSAANVLKTCPSACEHLQTCRQEELGFCSCDPSIHKDDCRFSLNFKDGANDDPELTEEGKDQAKQVKNNWSKTTLLPPGLEDEKAHISGVWVSPLYRTLQTCSLCLPDELHGLTEVKPFLKEYSVKRAYTPEQGAVRQKEPMKIDPSSPETMLLSKLQKDRAGCPQWVSYPEFEFFPREQGPSQNVEGEYAKVIESRKMAMARAAARFSAFNFELRKAAEDAGSKGQTACIVLVFHNNIWSEISPLADSRQGYMHCTPMLFQVTWPEEEQWKWTFQGMCLPHKPGSGWEKQGAIPTGTRALAKYECRKGEGRLSGWVQQQYGAALPPSDLAQLQRTLLCALGGDLSTRRMVSRACWLAHLHCHTAAVPLGVRLRLLHQFCGGGRC
mmetsp:Transcript_53250/g.133689  ORF Transcript_53250/g.133689 Transcript_53250/m.133689 type:complete len:418 (-) Transcript_53250:168-1421(-)